MNENDPGSRIALALDVELGEDALLEDRDARLAGLGVEDDLVRNRRA